MRRSTALTVEMIKLSNRRNLMLLGTGAGALGLGGLAGAAYMDSEPFERLLGVEPYYKTPAAAAARAERAAIYRDQAIAQGTRTGQQASKIMGNLFNDASFGVFNRSSPRMVFKEDEARAALAPNMTDRVFGLGRAARDQVGPIAGAFGVTSPPPSMVFTEDEARAALGPGMADGAFGAVRAGRGALGRLGGLSNFMRPTPRMVFTEDEARAALAPDQVMDFTAEESAAAMAPNLTDRMFGAQRLGRYQAARAAQDGLVPSIKTSSRSRALKALGAVAGLGALGIGGLTLGAPVAFNSLVDYGYNEFPEMRRMFRQPIYLDAADPFTSISNIRQRASDANYLGNDITATQPSTGFFDTTLDRVADQYLKGNFALGQGYLQNDLGGFRRRRGMPLASFE